MTVYKYKAATRDNQTTSGLIQAMSQAEAVKILGEKGLTIIALQEKTKRAGVNSLVVGLNRVTQKDLVIFSRQFSVLISANVTLVEALKVIAEQTVNPKLKTIITEIANDVDGGTRLSDALEKRPKLFSQFYINVVRSGETSGKLDEVLEYLADEMEKDYDLTSKIRGAMIYPIFVFCGLGVVGAIMMIVVVPRLTEIISETGAELPLSTKIIMAISSFLAGYWWALILGIIILFGLLQFYTRTETGKMQFDYLRLKLPVFGKLFQRIYLVRFSRSMHTLIAGGVTINQSLEIVSRIIDNKVFEKLIKETGEAVEGGNSISMVLSDSEFIPSMVSQMVSIGEKTGKLDLVLKKMAEFYTREVNNIVANLMTLMEPIIMVILGIAVGVMVAAIIMPMYNLAGQF